MSSSAARQRTTPGGNPHLQLAGDAVPNSLGALIAEAEAAERQGRREAARELYERALRGLSGPAEAPLASALLRWIARTYQADGDYDAALDCAAAAIAVGEACGDAGAVGHAVNVQAIVHWQQGQLDEAERLYLQARS